MAQPLDVSGVIPVRVQNPTTLAFQLLLVIVVIALAGIWLVAGVALLALTLGVAIAVGTVFLLWWATAFIVNLYFYLRRRTYPARYRFPLGVRRARRVTDDALSSSIPTTAAAAARGTILFLGPLVFFLRVPFGWKQWRERRRRVDVVDLPLSGSVLFRSTLRAVIDVASRWNFLVDGYRETTTEYNEWLEASFAEIGAFVEWWPLEDLPVESYSVFTPLPIPVDDQLSRETPQDLQPSPDPRGFPGLASAVIRRTRITGLRDLFHSGSEIGDMGDPNLDDSPECGVVRIVRTVNHAGERWIVQVSSTRSWLPHAGQAPNDLTADVHAVAGRESSLLRGVLAAMAKANIPVDVPILITGFSLGGIVAAQLATRNYLAPGFTAAHRFSHLITAGSPIARFRIAEGVRVLSLEHKLDPVHRLDGRPRATDIDSAVPWVTVSAGPPLPLDYTVGQTHHAPSYAETAQTFATGLDDDIARQYWTGVDGGGGASSFFVGTQTITDFAVMRDGAGKPRAAVPAYVQSAESGRVRGRLRAFLRRLDGVIAADVYLSREGFPSTTSWSIDILVLDLDQAMTVERRRFSYEGLLAVAQVRGAVSLNMRVMARNQRTGHISTSVSRAQGGAVREDIDVDGNVKLGRILPLTEDAVRVDGEGASAHITFLYPNDPL